MLSASSVLPLNFQHFFNYVSAPVLKVVANLFTRVIKTEPGFFTRKIIQIGEDEIEQMAERIFKREVDPFTAIERIIKQ